MTAGFLVYPFSLLFTPTPYFSIIYTSQRQLMSSLIPHIEYLLQRHDCLILPGIGAFVVEYTSARILPDEGIILPPSRDICFNGQINHDDGMLATSVSRSEGLKFEEARAIVADETTSIRRALIQDGEYNIGRIGTLLLGEENNISFIPQSTSESKMAEMGLSAAPLRSAIPVAAVEEKEKTAESPNNNLQQQGYQTRQFSDKNYYIAINKKFAKCAASIIAVICVAMAFIIPANQPGVKEPVKASMNPIESISQRNSAAASAITSQKSVCDDKDAEKVSNYGIKISSENGIRIPKENTESEYYLIVATFNSENEAMNFIDSRAGGSYTLTPVKGKNVWRVAAGRGDKSTLQSLLNSSEFNAAFSEAWIWKSN